MCVRAYRHKTSPCEKTFATAQPSPIILDSSRSEKPTRSSEKLSILGVIPARLASTRLPRKVLRTLAGRPMLAWVYDAASACPQLDRVLIATDSEEVAELCHRNHWPVQLTSPDLPSGTDRVHAISQTVHADIYVNIQGDEPLLKPQHLTALLRPFAHPHVEVSTLKVLCTPENIANPNAVKVVTATDGRALYFSRAAIPYDRDAPAKSLQTPPTNHPAPTSDRVAPANNHIPPQYWKHIGLYAYRKAALQRFPTLPHSLLEQAERLEQLRFLENGIPIHVEPTDYDTIGVDTEEDLQRVESLMRP